MNQTIYSVSGYGFVRDPQAEPRERTKDNCKTTAKVGDITVQVGVSCDAIANDWNRVERWLWERLPTKKVIPPCPACDSFTITLEYKSVMDMVRCKDKHVAAFERIVNSHPYKRRALTVR